MAKEELYDKIEQYLNNELSDVDRIAFEKTMTSDKELAAEVMLHRRMQEELSQTDKKVLRDNLRVVVNQSTPTASPSEEVVKKSGSGLWKWGLPLLALLGLLYFVLPMNKKVEESSPLPPTPKQEIPTSDPIPEEKVEEVKPPTKSIPQAKNEPKQQPKITPSPPPKQIAAIDPAAFSPNPHLEDQLNVGIRGEAEIKDLVLNDNQGTIKLKNGKATLDLKGTATKEGAYELFIYSNNPDDYINERPKLKSPLSIQAVTGDIFSFNFNAAVSLTPGLYYYLIAFAEDGEPLSVGKFEVR